MHQGEEIVVAEHLIQSQLICRSRSTLSNLSIRPYHADHVCSFLRDRPGDT
jgi:hypothetical protein